MLEMKNIFYILHLLAFIIMSCGNKISKVSTTFKSPNGYSYKESLNAWEKLKKTNSNSYEYEVHFESWIGVKSITKLKVINGKVFSRSYKFLKPNPNTGELYVSNSYIEKKDDIGKHEDGALPKTIDQLYASCISEYIIADTSENYVYFETNKSGIINLCGFVPKECVDDCYKGIKIAKFNWIE